MIEKSWRFLSYVYCRFMDDACIYRSTALTFTTLLSLVPLMTVSFVIYAAFPAFEGLAERVQKFIFTHFAPTSSEVILQHIQQFSKHSANLSIVGTLSLVVTAVLVLFTAEQTLNQIWRVKRHRKAISAFLLYWSVLTLIPVLAGLSFFVSSYLMSLPIIAGLIASGKNTYPIMLNAISFLLLIGAFTVFYVAVPNCQVRILHGFIGGTVAAILFELARVGFQLYVTYFPTYRLLYGALASIPLFLLWLYLVWIIILLGAEICHALAVYYRMRSDIKLDPFTHSFRWLGHMWRALQSGKALTLDELIAYDEEDYEERPETVLNKLHENNFINLTEDETYVLTKDLRQISLYELYQVLPWQLPKQVVDDILRPLIDNVHKDAKAILAASLENLYKGD